jgi:hypothetical protein
MCLQWTLVRFISSNILPHPSCPSLIISTSSLMYFHTRSYSTSILFPLLHPLHSSFPFLLVSNPQHLFFIPVFHFSSVYAKGFQHNISVMNILCYNILKRTPIPQKMLGLTNGTAENEEASVQQRKQLLHWKDCPQNWRKSSPAMYLSKD